MRDHASKRPDKNPAFEMELEWCLFAAVTAAAAITTTTASTVTATATATATTAVATAAPATAEAAAITTTATPEAATATGRTLFPRTGDVHGQGATLNLVPVEFLDALLGLLTVRHRDEGETAGTAGELVEDDLNDTDGANLAKQGLEVLGGAGEGKIPHVELVVF